MTTIEQSFNNAGEKTLRKINAADLLKGDKAVLIELDGSEYRLQLTRSHKLILTKWDTLLSQANHVLPP